ncbi:DUF262 domain-containing protein [Pseudenhygromyxa sp. WMMC2535]|uniref:GmrSD restriction endonuclease domain-containing protein n=1 Tax=Pseudenhygromyxa sp. WMMC2535 TaxID=2712867 RepID=UPI0015545454|nr:DUF262 domain-containing protein [Pseudenhygromyxa sp. WMMC2535]
MALPSLPTRPGASVLNIEDILRHAVRGRLRVPGFQRGLKWGPRHVEELFDSIVRGFPIGGLLLWKQPAEAAQLSFGPLVVDAPAIEDALLIVDGQQRVTALVGCLLHPDEQPIGGTHALWVNLATGAFEVLREIPSSPSPWLPVNVLGQRRRLQQWSRSASFGEQTEDFVDRAFQIEESIIRYELPAYTVEDASPSALRLIFSRVNHSGVALREDEVFQALFGDTDQPKPLDALAQGLHEETSFGMLPVNWLLRCLKAIAELSPKLQFGEHSPPPPELLASARTAMRAAISFLQREVGFFHASILPYRFPLIILARFFHLHPKPHPRSRTLLTRWLWRGALGFVHGNSSHASVASHLGDIDMDEHKSVQRLLERVPKQSPLPSAREAWYGQAAITRIYATSMLLDEPMQPEAEATWTRPALLAALNEERGLAELFPSCLRPPTSGSIAIAARAFLPTGVSTQELAQASDEVLSSLAIRGEATKALRAADFDAFVTARAAILEERLEALVSLRASPDENDRPPVSALLAG